MADDDKIIQQIDIRGDREVKTKLNQVATVGQRAFDKMGDASGRLRTSLASAGEGLKSIGSRIAPVAGGFAEAATAVSGMGGALGAFGAAAALAVGSMAALAVAGSKIAGDLKEAEVRVGTTADNIIALGFAAEQSGSSAESLERAFGVMFDAAEQGGEVLEPFKRLGVELTTAAGKARDPAIVFGELADKIAAIPDAASRSQAVIGLFGRRVGAGLVETLSLGSKGLDDFRKQVERLGLTFTRAELEVGEGFGDTLNTFQRVATATSAKIGVAFIPLFSGIVENASIAFGRLQPILVGAANSIRDTLQPLFDDIANAIIGNTDKINSEFILVLVKSFQFLATVVGGAIQGITFALGGLISLLDQVTGVFNFFFGTTLSGADLLAFAITGRLLLGFTSLFTVIRGGVVLVQALRIAFVALAAAGGPWTVVLLAVGAALGFILTQMSSEQWQAFGQQMIDLWTNIQTTISTVVQAVIAQWNLLKETVLGVLASVVEAFKPVINTINLWIDRLERGIELARSALFGGGGGGNAPGFASGGMPVRGPGTSTSDSILARVSSGEYINRAAAVRHYGVSFFEALNRMAIPKFAMGGLFDGLSPRGLPRFAEGGLMSSSPSAQRGVTLVLDGQTFSGLTGPEAVVARLEAAAIARQSRKTGRKPAWLGG